MSAVANLPMETIARSEGDAPAGWSISQGTFQEGLASGVHVIEVRSGDFSFAVLPTRGMGIWHAHVGETRIGWDSPVRMPVHPGFVNLQSRNGLGWLDGFNELLCRCGLSYNGPPGRDEAVGSPIESDLTLHGRIANLPAHSVELIQEKGRIGLSGIVDESTLFGPQLRLETAITTTPGGRSIQIRDVITNLGSSSTELVLLYHTNIGAPILEQGAQMICPASRIIPRDQRAAEGTETIAGYDGPTTGYSEQVYFYEMLADESDRSLALLHDKDGSFGVSLRFNRQRLPCFSQWKCTQSESDGYVTGLEPATNLPNFKAFERRNGRVVQLAAQQRYEVELDLSVHPTPAEVDAILKEIAEIQGETIPEVCPQPLPPYCSVD